jgi:hypothetical protein
MIICFGKAILYLFNSPNITKKMKSTNWTIFYL